jgi:hypothetical protein
MKKITLAASRTTSVLVSLLLIFGLGSCSNQAQQFLFSNHPTEYHKVKKSVAAATAPELTASLTASTAAQPSVILPAQAYAQEQARTEALAAELIKAKTAAPQAQATQKMNFKEKAVVLKKALKEVKAAKKEIKQVRKFDKQKAQAAGPVSNDMAIKIIIAGLILALLGLVIPFLYGLGGLVVVIGLVLLLINYL